MATIRQTIDERCGTCGNIFSDGIKYYCKILAYPEHQWTRIGGCAFRTHDRTVKKEEDKKLNPLKASRRSKQEIKT